MKDAFFTAKLLVDHKYAGTIGFDAHPYRSEADPWDFVDRNMRTYKIMQEKVHKYQENKEIQDLLREIHGANPGHKGLMARFSKDPVEATKWFRDSINFLCNYVLSQGYDIKFSIEPKPNEPRGDLYLPTVGSVLAFIATLDHPDMCGINPETAHIKMAGLNPYHEFAQALDAGKLLDVHLNGQ